MSHLILCDDRHNSPKKAKSKAIINGKKVLELDILKIFKGSRYEILGVSFSAIGYSTSFGRYMDALAIDADGSPCIIECEKEGRE